VVSVWSTHFRSRSNRGVRGAGKPVGCSRVTTSGTVGRPLTEGEMVTVRTGFDSGL
jgi:hypothetical protein